MQGGGTSPYAQKHKEQAGGTFRANSPFFNPDKHEPPTHISRSRWELSAFLFKQHSEALKPQAPRKRYDAAYQQY